MTAHDQHDDQFQQDDATVPSTEMPSAEQPVVVDESEYQSKWLRAQADYQNLLKEIASQKSEWAKMSELHILEEFIPVYEHFKKAFAHPVGNEHAQWENWKKGIEYIMKQFGDILRQHGVEEIKTVGEVFNPSLHEAVSEEISSEYSEGSIIRELSGGYTLGNKVIQVAKVVISKAS